MNLLTQNMPHLKVLGLKFNPFPVVPDSHNYFMTDRMSESIDDILHCIVARKGFILISGEVGLGKTTLSRLLLAKLAQSNIITSLVFNTFLQEKSLLKAINKDFNIFIKSDNIEDQLNALNRFLLTQYALKKNCVIVIDDAQQLSTKSLELIRQLSNLETNQNKLVQIILVAQGEILETLNRNDLRQLKSRIALNVKIEPFSLLEVRQYIDFRLARAGSNGQIRIDNTASKYLHKVTHGLPRQINLILDRCLYVVAAYDKNTIDKNLVSQAFQEISLHCKTKNKQLSAKALSTYAAVVVFGSFLGVAIYKKSIGNHAIDESVYRVQQNESLLLTHSFDSQQKIKPQVMDSIPKEKVKSSENKQLTLNEFLTNFDFGENLTGIANAIKESNMSKLAQQVKQLTDYKLLITSQLQQNQNKHLFWRVIDENKQQKWITFWQPEITLKAFYQGYYSDSIYLLQNRLKDLGYYHFNVDGIVGDKTLAGITSLQKDYGIDASGFPNDLTLYFLQHNPANTTPKENTYLSEKQNNKNVSNNKNKPYQLSNKNALAYDSSIQNINYR